MALVEQWNRIESGLDPRWSDLTLELALDDETQAERASALLGPAAPGRSGATIRFFASRGGDGVGPEAVRRLLRRIDGEGIGGSLVLDAASDAAPAAPLARNTLAAAWDAALGQLPTDWSDVLCELELTSSDHLDPAALLLGPLNPLAAADTLAYRFRAASTFGYGASAGMVRRCLSRLDEAGIPGDVRVLRVLSDTHPVGTQGPVWYVGGKAV
ncbi:MAG TPA: hypothetical protein VFM96_12950 [Gaiellaceae bacterium]|nr:hypothetical protein [Gaiellaceae bacterium]